MLHAATHKTLVHLIDLFARADLFWVLGGHAGLIVQGVDLEDDGELDICTSEDHARLMARLLKEHTVDVLTAVSKDHLHALRGLYRVEDTDVEILGDPVILGADEEWIGLPRENICETFFEGRAIEVFTLQSELDLYAAATWKAERNLHMANKIAEALQA